MKQCRTVVDLIEAFPLLYNRERGIMICDVEDVDSKEVKVKSGLFVNEDDQFEGQRILTAAFNNLILECSQPTLVNPCAYQTKCCDSHL